MYDWQEIKKQIINFSKTIEIDKIGFTSGEPFEDIKDVLTEHQDKGFNSGFEEKDINLRINPSLSLPGVSSIISIAIAYPSKETQIQDSQRPRGKFCRASWGRDYHQVLKERLTKLAIYITSLVPWAETLGMVDTGPLSDRAVAARAGLGWIGKNSNLVTEEYGSFVYLGELLTNLPLTPDKPVANKCGLCKKCLNACPTGAIIPGKSIINCQKCLAFQTLAKGELSNELKEKISEQKYIYGCDICQLVCPYNLNKSNDWHTELQPEYDLTNPVIEDLFKLTNKTFKNTFGHMSGSWRGKKILQRNAILILGKSNDMASIPLLVEILENDPRPEMRSAAAWALAQYNLSETQEI